MLGNFLKDEGKTSSDINTFPQIHTDKTMDGASVKRGSLKRNCNKMKSFNFDPERDILHLRRT